MENKHITIAVLSLLIIIAGMFVFTYLKKSELSNEIITPVSTGTKQDDSKYGSITRIDAKHFYIDGLHTIVGEILMPTPCDLLNWDTKIAESMPEQVTVAFTVVNHAESCAQDITPQRFKVSFKASEKALIKASLEGRFLEVNLIPASGNETPDDFELFIKG